MTSSRLASLLCPRGHGSEILVSGSLNFREASSLVKEERLQGISKIITKPSLVGTFFISGTKRREGEGGGGRGLRLNNRVFPIKIA